MRIDILVSVLPKGVNALEVHNLKNAIAKTVREHGYKKFVVVEVS